MTPSDMGKLRWQNVPREERRAFAKRINRRRNKLLSARERRAIATKASEAAQQKRIKAIINNIEGSNMHITKPFHSETRTIWYVYDAEECVATLEIGQKYRTAVGGEYKLAEVIWHTGYVQVIRNGDSYTWHVSSLINSNCTLIETENSHE